MCESVCVGDWGGAAFEGARWDREWSNVREIALENWRGKDEEAIFFFMT